MRWEMLTWENIPTTELAGWLAGSGLTAAEHCESSSVRWRAAAVCRSVNIISPVSYKEGKKIVNIVLIFRPDQTIGSCLV